MDAPKIRFRGFTKPWRTKRLGEVAEERNKQAPIDNEYPLMAFIAHLGVAPKGDRYDRSALTHNKQKKKYKRTELGDFIYSSNNLETGSIGLNTYGKASISPVYSIFKSKQQIDSNFLGKVLLREEFINQMISYRQGVVYGQWKIHEDDFLSIPISLPSLAEQKKIGALFCHLDSLIALEKKKTDALERSKKALLQKAFPAPGGDVPVFRFRGFTKPWRTKRLGEVADVYDGVHKTPNYQNNGVMFLSVENITTLHSEKYISEDAFKRDYKVYPQKNDILMTRIGDIGTTNVVHDDTPKAFYVSLALLKCKQTDPFFLSNAIKSNTVQKEILKRSLLTAIPMKINKEEISYIPLSLPSLAEQKKIGALFCHLDSLIALEKKKTQSLERAKKALLQKMFV